MQLEDLILAFVSLELAPIEPADAQARELREYYTAMTAALVDGCLTAQLEVRSPVAHHGTPATPAGLTYSPRCPLPVCPLRRSSSLGTCLSGTQSVAWPICSSARSRARSWPTSLAARSRRQSPTVTRERPAVLGPMTQSLILFPNSFHTFAALLEHHVAAGRLELAEQLVLHMDAAKLNLNDVGYLSADCEGRVSRRCRH